VIALINDSRMAQIAKERLNSKSVLSIDKEDSSRANQ
jgi:hypothetical protein